MHEPNCVNISTLPHLEQARLPVRAAAAGRWQSLQRPSRQLSHLDLACSPQIGAAPVSGAAPLSAPALRAQAPDATLALLAQGGRGRTGKEGVGEGVEEPGEGVEELLEPS